MNSCCTTGCAHCCYQLIEVFDFEKQSIKNAVSKLDDETKQTIKENLESWFVFFNRNAPDNKVLDAQDLLQNFHFLHPLNKHGCPLLVNNLCSIYNSRPLACRIHVVESNPSECEKDPYRASSKDSFDIRTNLSQQMAQKKHYMTLLPYILSEVINIESKIKPIKKMELK
ncbi:YkgJ family cysteine cluster protein [Chryseobacterium indologenes]|uniref:YkgJ family cysteine cluster protein n=1 Tax=Chryseobacterium indologenes TaxID=253 RepID=UPI003D33889A